MVVGLGVTGLAPLMEDQMEKKPKSSGNHGDVGLESTQPDITVTISYFTKKNGESSSRYTVHVKFW